MVSEGNRWVTKVIHPFYVFTFLDLLFCRQDILVVVLGGGSPEADWTRKHHFCRIGGKHNRGEKGGVAFEDGARGCVQKGVPMLRNISAPFWNARMLSQWHVFLKTILSEKSCLTGGELWIFGLNMGPKRTTNGSVIDKKPTLNTTAHIYIYIYICMGGNDGATFWLFRNNRATAVARGAQKWSRSSVPLQCR